MNSAAEHLRTDERDALAVDDFARTAALTPAEVREGHMERHELVE